MAVIKGKMKAGDKVAGVFKSVDTDENKVTINVDNKETIVTVNALTAEYIETAFEEGEQITIGFDGVDYDVD
jgi:hypothetical protein